MRVNANIGVSHIHRIVSESTTSLTKWSRHSIIFADAAVHFPNYDLDQFLCRSYYSSFVRVISLFFDVVPYEKYFARRHKVRRFAARVSSHICPRTVRVSFRELFLLLPVNCGQYTASTASEVADSDGDDEVGGRVRCKVKMYHEKDEIELLASLHHITKNQCQTPIL